MTMSIDEQRALAHAVRDAASHGPREFLSEAGQPIRDEQLWKVLVEQIGLTGLLVPEEHGGAGAGIAELSVVLEELAASLAVVPALSSIGMATALLRVSQAPAASVLASRLADGTATAAVAWPKLLSDDFEPTVSLDAPGHQAPGEDRYSGIVELVLDGAAADVLLLPALRDDAVVVVAVETDDAEVEVEPLQSLDLTRGLSRVKMSGAQGVPIASAEDLRLATDLALVMVAAEQVGVAQRCHDAAVEWAKERVQFDRPIGQFQAIKHTLVDLLMFVELGRSSLDVAVKAADEYLAEPTDALAVELRVAASLAKARCGDAATKVADESLHIFGGLGFTWEHDAHLYYRRAKSLELSFGDSGWHRRRFATILLEEASRGI